MKSADKSKVVVVAFPGVQMLDVAGPADVFTLANSFNVEPFYELVSASTAGGATATLNGIDIVTRPIIDLPPAGIDTLIVAGGAEDGLMAAIQDQALAAWIRLVAATARRYGSVCSGAFALAEWGLLDGSKVTTHWSAAATLDRHYPNISVEADAIYVQDGRLWTSGGVTSGIDMCLGMVEHDLGRWVASRVAKQLILPVRRLGNQSQFSLVLDAQAGRYASLVDWVRTHLQTPISNDELAARAGESQRSFHRHFLAETGQTPAAFVEALRLQVAREHLEQGASAKAAARAAGFTSDEHLVRVFVRRFRMTPAQYRMTHGTARQGERK
ncbi:AraC family transcriptional regulator [Pseudomonas taeanensis MS-3]|uniref:AraC family transcriptional regulator n=1 Tax=Pseudomonas taeanensis MS-3 TaxID=1395571 RepID=A0A0A1YJL8_9PSED|nr:helix-turn-helix domain-containing protein [Pseudomonas taeanensis]KFX70090.1 AraC family transcriptional regulator [Pseudomonas taeanensis MS-3]